MVIYGVALLAFCFISGLFLGELLGRLIGIEAVSYTHLTLPTILRV